MTADSTGATSPGLDNPNVDIVSDHGVSPP